MSPRRKISVKVDAWVDEEVAPLVLALSCFERVVTVGSSAAGNGEGETPGGRLTAWLRRFAAFFLDKHEIATELLEEVERDDPVFDGSRARVLAAGQKLLRAAQDSGEVRNDLTLEQTLDMVIAVSAIRGDPAYREPILQAALDGLRRPRA